MHPVVEWGRAQQRSYLLQSFFHFAKYSGMCPDIDEESYGPVCDYLEARLPNTPAIARWRLETGRLKVIPRITKKKFGIFLIPRLTYKTSLIAALSLFAYLLDHSIRIMLGRATTNMSEETLRRITTHIVQNEILRSAFGDLRSHFTTWAKDEIVSGQRDPGIAEPTIGTTGLNTSKTGAHNDLVLLDDLVHELNFESPEQMETGRRLVTSFEPVIMGWGSLLLIGTRWGDNDLYGWVMEQDDMKVEAYLAQGKHAERVWDRFVLGAYDDNGNLTFPISLPEAKVEEYRRSPTIDSKMFSAWILNVTRAEGEDIFNLDSIRYFDGECYGGLYPELRFDATCIDLIKRFGHKIPLSSVMLVDPAPTVGKYSDSTGIVIVGFDPDANWWVLHAEEVKLLPDPRLHRILELCREFQPALLALENADLSAPLLEQRLRAMGMITKVVAFDPRMDRRKITASALAPRGRTKKAAQIERLQHPLKDGRVHFHRGTTAPLIRQLTKYPYIDHDDVIDAFSMAQAYEQQMVIAASDQTPEKIYAEIERREFALEGLNMDGSDVDEPRKPGPIRQHARPG